MQVKLCVFLFESGLLHFSFQNVLHGAQGSSFLRLNSLPMWQLEHALYQPDWQSTWSLFSYLHHCGQSCEELWGRYLLHEEVVSSLSGVDSGVSGSCAPSLGALCAPYDGCVHHPPIYQPLTKSRFVLFLFFNLHLAIICKLGIFFSFFIICFQLTYSAINRIPLWCFHGCFCWSFFVPFFSFDNYYLFRCEISLNTGRPLNSNSQTWSFRYPLQYGILHRNYRRTGNPQSTSRLSQCGGHP